MEVVRNEQGNVVQLKYKSKRRQHRLTGRVLAALRSGSLCLGEGLEVAFVEGQELKVSALAASRLLIRALCLACHAHSSLSLLHLSLLSTLTLSLLTVSLLHVSRSCWRCWTRECCWSRPLKFKLNELYFQRWLSESYKLIASSGAHRCRLVMRLPERVWRSSRMPMALSGQL